MGARTALYRSAAVATLLTLTTAGCVSTTGTQTAQSPSTSSSPSASVSAAPSTPPTSPATQKIWVAGDPAFGAIQALLDKRAQAIADGDQAAFDATLDTSDPAFVAQQNVEFANLGKLGVTDISYSVQQVALTPASVDTSDPLLRPNVTEHVTIPGVDRHPVGNAVNFTFVEHDGRWLLATETFVSATDLFDYSHPSQSRPWAPGAIAVARKGDLVVLTDVADAAKAPTLATSIAQGIREDDAVLGMHSSMRLLVDATTNTGDGFSWTGAAVDYAAFTFPIASLDKNGNATGQIAGWGIKLNPSDIESLMNDTHVLHHELTHYIMRSYQPFPTWLSEGLAEYVGWQPSVISQLQVPKATYDSIVKAAETNELPSSAVFQTFADVNYPIAQGAVTYLVGTCGIQGVLDLIKSYQGHGDVGMGDGYTRTALQKVCNTTEADVAAGALGEVKTLGQY